MKYGALLLCAAAWAQPPFHLDGTIALAGVEGRIDHLSFDVRGQRLVLAALGNNTVEVLDLATRGMKTISGMHEPQGVAYVPDTQKIYVANGKDGKLRIIDGASLQPAGEVMFGGDADNVRYDSTAKLLWVGYGDGALGSFDVATGKRTGKDVPLDGHPESFQLEAHGARVFVNVPDAHEIQVVDRAKRSVLAKWPVTGASANYPMALDEAAHRVFVGCRRPARVLVFDMETGKTVTEFPCPGDTDDLFFDAARKHLYVIGGEGFVEAFQQQSPDRYQSLGKIATAPGGRTGLYVPDLSRLFLAVPHRGNQHAEVRIFAVLP